MKQIEAYTFLYLEKDDKISTKTIYLDILSKVHTQFQS